MLRLADAEQGARMACALKSILQYINEKILPLENMNIDKYEIDLVK